jgi:hypothetical protein
LEEITAKRGRKQLSNEHALIAKNGYSKKACTGSDIQVTPPFNIYKIEVVEMWDERKYTIYSFIPRPKIINL